MPDAKPRRLDQLFAGPGGRLGALAARARRLAAAERDALDGLDPDLTPHCRLVGLESGRAVVAVDSPAWATRLRYHTAQIREKLHAAGHRVEECRVIVAAAAVRTGSGGAPGPRPAMDPRGAATLTAAADGVADDALAAALRRLARNGRQA